ncbi:MAG TPA: hypothetical protein VGE96_03975 [Steroidobacteraceae bacterium]|jgi:hypothetical protein
MRLAAASAITCVAGPALAASDWVFDPRVELGAIYDDNYRLTDQPGQEIDVTGAALDAALGMRAESTRGKLGLTPRIAAHYFPDESSENHTDYYLDALAERHTQRLISSINASFADESVISSELAAADFPGLSLGQTASGDSGLVTVRNRRTLIAVNPSLQYDWTERRHLHFDLQYLDARYESQFTEQVGYKDFAGSAGISWDVSQRNVFIVSALGDRYSPDDSDPDTSTGGVSMEWRTSPSQVRTYYFRAGVRHSERNATSTSADVSETSFNGGLGASWQLQTTRFVIDLLRSTAPSSAGVVVNRDEVRFRLTHLFGPRFSGFIAARGIKTHNLDDNSADPVRDRKYATGSTGFEWRASRQISLTGSYAYRWQEFENTPTDARSNGVFVSVVYEPRRLN